ncbi:MAG: T9SS type A sorting domain-containing protein [Bacteroidetes bacterium]|nr:T9SS type A sorting domain-containing protein [Bacteroidota bacterium]
MKIKNLLLLVVILINEGIFAQSPVIEWQKTLGGTDADIAKSIEPTADSGYIVAGFTASNDGDASGNHGGMDFWVVKLGATGNKLWQKTLGGSNNDFANAVHQTSDGGYIVAGYTFSNDGDVSGNHNPDSDGWVVKLNASGNLIWQKALGGVGGDFITDIHQTSDGGYIAGGYSASNNGDASGNNGSFDFWIVKLDPSGNISWHKMVGSGQNDRANAIQQTSDGGYIVAGSVASNINGQHDCQVVKLDASGNIMWQKTQGGTGDEYYNAVQQTTDGGYILAGITGSNNGDVSGNHGIDDFWIVKLNSSGNIIWQKTLGGSDYDWAYAIQQTSDGGYVALGMSNSTDGDVANNHGSADFWVAKLDVTGNLAWQKSIGGSDAEYGYSIRQTSDDGFIIAGYTNSSDGDVNSNQGNGDLWVVKLGAAGTLSLNFISFSAVASDNDVLLNWSTENEVNTNLFEVEFSTDGTHFTKIGNVQSANTSGRHQYNFTHHQVPAGMLFYRLKQIDMDGKYKYSVITSVVFNKINAGFIAYPSPANNEVNILINTMLQHNARVKLFSVKGQLLMTVQLKNRLTNISTQNIANGTYILSVENGSVTQTQKIIVQH